MNFHQKFLTLASTAFLSMLLGCGTEETEQTSEQSITGGTTVLEKFQPHVAWISSGSNNCTGTFISDEKMLTAAHCIKGKVTYYGTTSVEAIRAVSHPQWIDEGGTTVSDHLVPYDLAVVYFPKGTGKDWAIMGPAPKAGNWVKIMGFGSSDWRPDGTTSGGGVLRTGENRVLDISGGKITIEGVSITDGTTSLNSAAARGDSGGPMFLSFPPHQPWKILVGVTSAGVLSNGRIKNSYVDLNSASSIQFLRSQGIR